VKARKPKAPSTSIETEPKPQAHTTSARPLSTKALKALNEGVLAGEKLLDVSLALNAPDEIQSCIQERIESFRSKQASINQANIATVSLATLWGQVLCDSLGWQWAMIRDHTGEAAGLVSPDGAYVVMVHPCFYNLLAHSRRGPTSLELYQMIKTGDLPPSKPNSYLVLR